jgi:hypothetical protein
MSAEAIVGPQVAAVELRPYQHEVVDIEQHIDIRLAQHDPKLKNRWRKHRPETVRKDPPGRI